MTSVQVGLLTTFVATPLGVIADALFVSCHRATTVISLLLITPMIVPVILIAIWTIYAYGRVGMNNTIAGQVLAHTPLALPFAIIVVTAGPKSYILDQEQVARSRGAT